MELLLHSGVETQAHWSCHTSESLHFVHTKQDCHTGSKKNGERKVSKLIVQGRIDARKHYVGARHSVRDATRAG